MSTADLIALHGAEWSLVLERIEDGLPVWRHLGLRVDPGEFPPVETLRGEATFSLDRDLPMPVFPVAGSGWFGPPALALRGEDGLSLPVMFDQAEVASADERLRIDCSDTRAGVACVVEFRRERGGGLAIASTLTNSSVAPITIERFASAVLPFSPHSERILSWQGRHNAEFVPCDEAMPAHGWVRETRLGMTGHGGPCGCYVLSRAAGWDLGETFALQLAWSGDSRLIIEKSDEGFWICQAEAVLASGECIIQPGEAYTAPTVLLAISGEGRNGAMAQQHVTVRSRVNWPGGAMSPRPVHLNSWEACYFAHDAGRIGELAEAAAGIGIERFILDDGWFAGRNSDRAGLGDWTPDPIKYPDGLRPVAEQVTQLGMQFGLWVEPEMVNPDSELYRTHPDWVMALPERDRPTARNQLVLDMRREDVREYLFDCLDQLLSNAPISYLKWDHNRAHAPSGGAAQTRGTNALFERLRAAHPQVEIESCAAGGGRIDAGIASHTHRFWTSDNIDALARVPIQRGFLSFIPPELMGSHVGATPSHATGRRQSLDFRAAIACQGHFGVELDPAAMEATERERLADWIAFYKQWRDVIHGGRTLMGETDDGLTWQAQGAGGDMLLWVIRCEHGADRHATPVRLPFAAGSDWNVRLLRHAGARGVLTPRPASGIAAMRETPQRFTGSWLANAGLPVSSLSAESALIYHLQAVA